MESQTGAGGFAADPHGLNTDGTTFAWPSTTTIRSRVPTLPSVAIRLRYELHWWRPRAIRDGVGAMGDPPNRWITAAPRFAGASGPTAFIERS
jgi:hypothetical protein